MPRLRERKNAENSYTNPYHSSQLAPSDERDDQLEEIRHEDEQRKKADEEAEEEDEEYTYSSSQMTQASEDASSDDYERDADSSQGSFSVQTKREIKLYTVSVQDESYDPDEEDSENEDD